MDLAYITRNNFKKVSRLVLEEVFVEDAFLMIYEENMSEVLNHMEAKDLYKQKKLIEGNFESSYKVKKIFNKKYIFSVSPPKFHKNNNCVFLGSDFKNYLVPPAIEALGEEKVKEFQLYCEENRKYFEGKSDEVFWLHVGAKFNVAVTPQPVLYHNSGIQELEGMSVLELKDKVDDSFNKSMSMVCSEEFSRVIRQYRYAPSMQRALKSITNDEVKRTVKVFYLLKMDIINTLLELYKKQSNSDGFALPVSLLQDCEFEHCNSCWK